MFFTSVVAIFLLLQQTLSVEQDANICVLSSCVTLHPGNYSIEKRCTAKRGLAMRGRCCVRLTDDDIVGVDLSFCDVKSLGRMLYEQCPHVERLNLTNNPQLQIDHETFRGLSNLSMLSLPPELACPGNWSWFNTSWVSWDETKLYRHMRLCQNQTDTCASLATFNYSCPEHSTCMNDGPGMFLCDCEPGWSDYKCQRASTGKPTVALLGGTAASTLLLSLILWYTERRHVIR